VLKTLNDDDHDKKRKREKKKKEGGGLLNGRAFCLFTFKTRQNVMVFLILKERRI
jgi:hypothetical protein